MERDLNNVFHTALSLSISPTRDAGQESSAVCCASLEKLKGWVRQEAGLTKFNCSLAVLAQRGAFVLNGQFGEVIPEGYNYLRADVFLLCAQIPHLRDHYDEDLSAYFKKADAIKSTTRQDRRFPNWVNEAPFLAGRRPFSRLAGNL